MPRADATQNERRICESLAASWLDSYDAIEEDLHVLERMRLGKIETLSTGRRVFVPSCYCVDHTVYEGRSVYEKRLQRQKNRSGRGSRGSVKSFSFDSPMMEVEKGPSLAVGDVLDYLAGEKCSSGHESLAFSAYDAETFYAECKEPGCEARLTARRDNFSSKDQAKVVAVLDWKPRYRIYRGHRIPLD